MNNLNEKNKINKQFLTIYKCKKLKIKQKKSKINNIKLTNNQIII